MVSGQTRVRYSLLISEITKENKYLSYRSPSEVESALTKGYFLLAFDKDKLVGWIEHMPIWKTWWGLFSFYVLPPHRKRGIGTSLLEKATSKHKNGVVYVATFNRWVEKKLKSLGYRKVSRLNLPLGFLINILIKRFLNSGLVYNLPLNREHYSFFVHFPDTS